MSHANALAAVNHSDAITDVESFTFLILLYKRHRIGFVVHLNGDFDTLFIANSLLNGTTRCCTHSSATEYPQCLSASSANLAACDGTGEGADGCASILTTLNFDITHTLDSADAYGLCSPDLIA